MNRLSVKAKMRNWGGGRNEGNAENKGRNPTGINVEIRGISVEIQKMLRISGW